MRMWIVAGIERDDRRGGTVCREHADEDQIHVVDPVEGGIPADIEAFLAEHIDTALTGFEIRIELVVDVFVGMDIGNRAFVRIGVGSDFNFIAQAVPVGSLGVCFALGNDRAVWRKCVPSQ